MAETRIKVLVAKPGLDGHDRGAKVIVQFLKDEGFDAVYTGLHRSAEQIVEAAKKERADIIGLSVLSGAYLSLCEKLFDRMREEGIAHIPVVVGGVIREGDDKLLKEMGVAEVFPSGTPLEAISEAIKRLARGPG